MERSQWQDFITTRDAGKACQVRPPSMQRKTPISMMVLSRTFLVRLSASAPKKKQGGEKCGGKGSGPVARRAASVAVTAEA